MKIHQNGLKVQHPHNSAQANTGKGVNIHVHSTTRMKAPQDHAPGPASSPPCEGGGDSSRSGCGRTMGGCARTPASATRPLLCKAVLGSHAFGGACCYSRKYPAVNRHRMAIKARGGSFTKHSIQYTISRRAPLILAFSQNNIGSERGKSWRSARVVGNLPQCTRYTQQNECRSQ